MLTFKLLTHKDETKIDNELKGLKKINKFQKDIFKLQELYKERLNKLYYI